MGEKNSMREKGFAKQISKGFHWKVIAFLCPANQRFARLPKQKGFVISVSTFLVLITVVWFSIFYSGLMQNQEAGIYSNYPIEKAGFVADDIIWDVNQIVGIGQNVERGTDSMQIEIKDKLPADINKLQLIDYNKFIDTNYSEKQNASITLNFANLLDGKAELLFSNGLVYEHQYLGDENYVMFYKDDPHGTEVLSYDINVFVQNIRYDAANSTAWNCDSKGTVTVNLRYRDSYGESVNSFCTQKPNSSYSYSFAFVDVAGNLTVSFGRIGGNKNSVKIANSIENPNAFAIVSIDANLVSTAEEMVWYYDADLIMHRKMLN